MSAPGRVQNIKKQFEGGKDSDLPSFYQQGGPLLLSKSAVSSVPAGIKRSPAFRNDKVVPRKTPVPTPRAGALVATPKPSPFGTKRPTNNVNKPNTSPLADAGLVKNYGQLKPVESPPKRTPFGPNTPKAAVQLSRVLVESNSKGLTTTSKVSTSAVNLPLIGAKNSPSKFSPGHDLQTPKMVKVAPAKIANNNAKNSAPKLTTFGSPTEPTPPKSTPRPSPPGPAPPRTDDILNSPLPKGPPPQKPPRTFAHSLSFFEEKSQKETKRPPVRSISGPLKPASMKRPTVPPPAMPARSKTESQIVRKNKNKTKAVLAACICPPPKDVPPMPELSRSQSMEHVYAVPFVPKKEDGVPVKVPIELTRTNKQGLYYMSTPIQWPARPTNLPVNSFNPQRSPKTSPPCAKVLPTLRESPKMINDPMMDHNRIQLLVNEAFNSVQLTTPDPSTDSEDCLTPVDRDFSLMDRSSPSEDDNEEEAKRMVERRKGYVKRASSFAMSQTRIPHLERTNMLFESVLLVGLLLDQDSRSYQPYIKSKFPANAQVPENIKYFVFPDSEDWPPKEGSEHKKPYSIVLTGDSGERSYGYCRRVVPEGTNLCLPLAYCILTKHRASGFFYKLLAEVESRHGQPDAARISMLSALQAQHLPKLGCSLVVPNVTITRPPDQRLEDSELSALFSCLPSKLLLKLVASVLHERQVVLVSSSLNKLTSCVTAMQSVLDPFHWQHTLVAALPSSATEICNAPTPFVVGVLKSKTGVIPHFSIEEGMAVDLDFGKPIHQVGDEFKILPGRLQKALNLALQVVASTTAATEPSRNVLVSEAFVRFFVEACGHYRNHIVTQQDGKIVFERESFVKAKESRSLQHFLEWFTETSLFSCFIDDRTNLSAVSCNNSVFDTRVQQHFRECEKNSLQIMKNYKIINKKVKTFGDRIRDLVH